MGQQKIEKHFAKKGIKVIFNTLGHTPELVHSFVSDYRDIVDKSNTKRSEHVKISTYSDMYTFEVRPKLTGFESFKHKDKNFRQYVQKFIHESQFSPSLLVDNVDLDKTKSYKTLLSESLEKIENPLLYLSGGMDSELVAYAFLEKNIKFKVVVFEYVDIAGNVKNFDDVKYAYKFCSRNGIIPEIVQINIEHLWDTEEFKCLAIDLQYASPQLATYAYMVELMSVKYPTATHMFGGEVKFFTNYWKDNGELANVVLLEKIVPAYNGQNYFQQSGCSQFVEIFLSYYADGSYAITGDIALSSQTFISGGSWYNGTPTSPYGYMGRVSAIYSTTQDNGGFLAATSFLNIPAGGVTLASGFGNGSGFSQANTGGLYCQIEVKETVNPGSGVFAEIGLYATSLCF
jgi:hypothetical protein